MFPHYFFPSQTRPFSRTAQCHPPALNIVPAPRRCVDRDRNPGLPRPCILRNPDVRYPVYDDPAEGLSYPSPDDGRVCTPGIYTMSAKKCHSSVDHRKYNPGCSSTSHTPPVRMYPRPTPPANGSHQHTISFSAVSHRTQSAFAVKAAGLRSVFLASWSLDPRAVTDQAAAAGRAAAKRIKNFQFTRGQPRVSGPALSDVHMAKAGGGYAEGDGSVLLVQRTGASFRVRLAVFGNSRWRSPSICFCLDHERAPSCLH